MTPQVFRSHLLPVVSQTDTSESVTNPTLTKAGVWKRLTLKYRTLELLGSLTNL
jgi:hypothetical protein